MSSATDAINRMLAVVAGELGTQHNQGSRGTNKYGRWYDQKYAGGKGIYSNGQFCAMGLSWAADRAGIPTDVLPPHAYTPSGVAWFRSRGRFTSGMKGIRRGDYWYSSCAGLGRVSHVGIVERVHSDGSIDCLEFNTTIQNLPPNHPNQRTGGWVARKRRYSACSLGGYARPDYASITPEEDDMTPELDARLSKIESKFDDLAKGVELAIGRQVQGGVNALQRRGALEAGLTLGFVRFDGPGSTVFATEWDGSVTPISPETWSWFRKTPLGAKAVVADVARAGYLNPDRINGTAI